MQKTRAVIFFALLLNGHAARTAENKPNIILITIDTLRADRLGCYGYTRDTSPNIDRFARENILFKNCYANASLTTPSIASLMTGLYPHQTGLRYDGGRLPQRNRMLAEILKTNGYTTVAIISNFVLRKSEGYDQGFDYYDDSFPNPLPSRPTHPEKRGDIVTRDALKWLKQLDNKPFFLWVHYMDPHGPYDPPAAFREKFKESKSKTDVKFNKTTSGFNGIPNYQRIDDHRNPDLYSNRYDGEIAYVDQQVGILLDEIANDPRLRSSLVILTSDHGEAMGEHNYYFCHGENLYREVTRVPLIIKWSEGKGISTKAVQIKDVFQTALLTLGISHPNLLPEKNLLSNTYQPSPVYMEIEEYRSVISHGFQTIWDIKNNTYLFFNVETDPAEEKDLFDDSRYTDELKKQKSFLIKMEQQKTNQPPAEKNRELSPEDLEALRSLGYAQ